MVLRGGVKSQKINQNTANNNNSGPPASKNNGPAAFEVLGTKPQVTPQSHSPNSVNFQQKYASNINAMYKSSNKRHIDISQCQYDRDQSKISGDNMGDKSAINSTVVNEDLQFSLGTPTQLDGQNQTTLNSQVQSRSCTPLTINNNTNTIGKNQNINNNPL